MSEDRFENIKKLEFGVQCEIVLAVSRVEAAFGPVKFDLKLSYRKRLEEGALACCVRKTNEIILSREYFEATSLEVLNSIVEHSIKMKFHPDTKMKLSSIVVHELCHAVGNMIEDSGVKLYDEIIPIAKRWTESLKEKKYLKCIPYAGTNICEFWAEMLTLALCGEADEYAKEVYKIAKKYTDELNNKKIDIKSVSRDD